MRGGAQHRTAAGLTAVPFTWTWGLFWPVRFSGQAQGRPDTPSPSGPAPTAVRLPTGRRRYLKIRAPSDCNWPCRRQLICDGDRGDCGLAHGPVICAHGRVRNPLGTGSVEARRLGSGTGLRLARQ